MFLTVKNIDISPISRRILQYLEEQQPQQPQQQQQQPQQQPSKVLILKKEDIEFGQVIGTGAFGQVQKCRLKVKGLEQGLYAVKKVKFASSDPKNQSMESLKLEIEVLRKIEHPYIVPLVGIHQSEKNVMFITALFDASLSDMIEKRRSSNGLWFSVKEMNGMIWMLLEALKYLHSLKIAHRDLKVNKKTNYFL